MDEQWNKSWVPWTFSFAEEKYFQSRMTLMCLMLTTHTEGQSPFRHFVSGAWESHGWKILAGLFGWSAGLALFLTTENGGALEWGCSFPGRLSIALKLLIYYYQQHTQSRLEGYTAMTSFFYLCQSIFVFKDLFTLFAGCRPGLKHILSDTSLVKCKNKEQNNLKLWR